MKKKSFSFFVAILLLPVFEYMIIPNSIFEGDLINPMIIIFKISGWMLVWIILDIYVWMRK